MDLRGEINRFLRANPDFPPSKLGREIANDPSLITKLRRGHVLRDAAEERMKVKLQKFLESWKAKTDA
jgi:hypothetical protein